jgi:hypothetical protein
VADLIDTLRRIERRAKDARQTIATGQKAGLAVNGTSALRDIEMAARDLLADLGKQTGGPKAARRGTTPSSAADERIGA